VGVLVRDADDVELVASQGDTEAVFGWASVSKLLVAVAALVAYEEEMVGLEDPVGPPGSTLFHLLSHASGLAMNNNQWVAKPGTRRIYSNTGIEVAAGHLEARLDRPWVELVRENVLVPCGLDRTEVPQDLSPAWGTYGPLRDLVALATEFVVPTVLTPSTLDLATSVAFAGIPGSVPGVGRYEDCVWGLGFELKGDKQPHWTATTGSPRTFGHFGRSGAFVWVDPDAGVAAVAGGGAKFGPWAMEAWPAFSDAVLSEFG
jgi:CubicO group peptidase (beta-lactamase class C family)